MEGILASIYRRLVYFGILSWISLSGWSWFVVGSYSTCGVGIRLVGFATWGLVPMLLPAIMVAPPIEKDWQRQWRAKLSWSCIIPTLALATLLLGWMDMPRACVEGDILAYGGLLFDCYVIAGMMILCFVVYHAEEFCSRRKR